MDPRNLNLTNRLNREEDSIINIDSRIIGDRKNLRRLDTEMTDQQDFASRQQSINENSHRNHYINIAIFVLMAILILIVAVISGLAFQKSNDADFPENSISSKELDNLGNFTMKTLDITSGANSALHMTQNGGITFGTSTITADQFRVLDDLTEGVVSASTVVVADSNKSVVGFTLLGTAGMSVTAGLDVLGGASISGKTVFGSGVSFLNHTAFEDRAQIFRQAYGESTTLSQITSSGYKIPLSASGYNYFIDYSHNDSIKFILPPIETTHTALNYAFTWVEGMSVGDKNTFSISTSGDDRMSGNLVLTDVNTNAVTSVSSNSIFNTEQPDRLDLTSKVVDGSVLNVKSFKGRWVVSGDMGVSRDANTEENAFQDLSLKNWILGGASRSDTNISGDILFSNNGKNWHTVYKIPSVVDSTATFVNKPAFGTTNDGTSLWVIPTTSRTYGDLLYSETGTSWYESTGTCFKTGGANSVAYGLTDTGSSLWVSAGYGNTASGNLMWSSNGTCWTNSSNVGTAFSVQGKGVAFGMDSDGGSCLWVSTGEDNLDNGNLMWSSNGTCWVNSTSSGASFNSYGNKVAFGTDDNGVSRWVAVGNDTSDNYRNILYSTNGTCWMNSSSASGGVSFGGFGTDVAFGRSATGTCMWVAVSADNTSDDPIIYSINGEKWLPSVKNPLTTSGFQAFSVAFGDSTPGSCLWVVTGVNNINQGHDTILYSSDGQNWFPNNNGATVFGGFGVGFNRPLYPLVNNIYDN